MNLTTIFALVPVAIALLAYVVMQTLFFVALLRARTKADRTPPERACRRAPVVSVLKPLAGTDDDLEANLASFAALDYPGFEILIGVAKMTDPAFPIARRFLLRHPDLRARIVITDPDATLNPKVAQLVGLEAQAVGEVIVISDSNVRVPKDYLWSLVRHLEDPKVGLVTSLFCGTGEQALGAALENLQLGAVIAPSIVACDVLGRLLGTRPLTVGKSMAMRKRDLAMMGGFRPVGHVLAEDHLLGRMFLDAGMEIRTALETIENRNVSTDVRRTFERHTRWAKMRRAIAPRAFLFEPLLSPLAVATITALLWPTRAQVAAAVAALAVQMLAGLVAVRLLRGRPFPWYYAPLEIVRTYVALACWARALASRRVAWRGHTFVLGNDSALRPAATGRSIRDRIALGA